MNSRVQAVAELLLRVVKAAGRDLNVMTSLVELIGDERFTRAFRRASGTSEQLSGRLQAAAACLSTLVTNAVYDTFVRQQLQRLFTSLHLHRSGRPNMLVLPSAKQSRASVRQYTDSMFVGAQPTSCTTAAGTAVGVGLTLDPAQRLRHELSKAHIQQALAVGSQQIGSASNTTVSVFLCVDGAVIAKSETGQTIFHTRACMGLPGLGLLTRSFLHLLDVGVYSEGESHSEQAAHFAALYRKFALLSGTVLTLADTSAVTLRVDAVVLDGSAARKATGHEDATGHHPVPYTSLNSTGIKVWCSVALMHVLWAGCTHTQLFMQSVSDDVESVRDSEGDAAAKAAAVAVQQQHGVKAANLTQTDMRYVVSDLWHSITTVALLRMLKGLARIHYKRGQLAAFKQHLNDCVRASISIKTEAGEIAYFHGKAGRALHAIVYARHLLLSTSACAHTSALALPDSLSRALQQLLYLNYKTATAILTHSLQLARALATTLLADITAVLRLSRVVFGGAGVSPTLFQRVYIVTLQVFDLLDKGIAPGSISMEPLEESHVLYKQCYRHSSRGGGFLASAAARVYNKQESYQQVLRAIEMLRSGMHILSGSNPLKAQYRRNAAAENKLIREFKVTQYPRFHTCLYVISALTCILAFRLFDNTVNILQR
jgi:hypothetical protein